MMFLIVLICVLQAVQVVLVISFLRSLSKETKIMRREIDRINSLMKYNP